MHKIKSCIIFSISIVRDDKLYVLREYLQLIKDLYSECKVFIGINYGSHADIETIIDSYNLNTVYARLTEHYMYTGSDDSAYQIALKLFYQDPTCYDVCWFMHTKGGFNERTVERELYIDKFFTKKDFIESKFAQLTELGVFGYRAGEYWSDPLNPVEPHITNNFMRAFWSDYKIDNFNYTFCKMIIVETMFALRASLLYSFLNTYPEFFYTKLRKYFFECEITNFLSTRSGYFPAILKGNIFTEASMDPLVDEWIADNNLNHLSKYKILTKYEE